MNKGFSVIALIAVIAVLAIGGGVYFSSQNSGDDAANTENTENSENSNSENKSAKGTFRSLMSLGKTYKCSITTVVNGVSSSGVVYIDGQNKIRTDFTSTVNGQAMSSSMIKVGETMYSWSGSQGIKMVIKESETSAEASSNSNQSVDLDQEVDYRCEDWSKDDSMFAPPASVSFFELGAGMPNGIPTGVPGASKM